MFFKKLNFKLYKKINKNFINLFNIKFIFNKFKKKTLLLLLYIIYKKKIHLNLIYF